MGKAPEDRLVGKVFEKCRIIGKLGTGGMGSVWLAEHFGLGRKVAVKILPGDMGRDPEYVARFMREATTAGRMEHPNIVQIHDVGYAEGRHFLVMQYVDGESLSTVVDTLGAMDPRDAAKVAAGILRGLQHAHEQGIVHRDVKPDNVLVAKGDQPMLLDFGLAIETETALQITKDGMVVGTPYYLSPEQARGQKATPLSDQYAAGVTLYYLLTGKRPFVGATALAVLNKHIHEAPLPPHKIRPAVPSPLSDIVLKMMAKRPEDRYPNAGAASADLEAFLAGKAVHARIPFRLPSLRTFPSWPRNHQLIAAGGAAGILLVLGFILVALLFGDDGSPRPPAVVLPKPVPPPAEPTENPELHSSLEFEKQNRENLPAYGEIVRKYEVLIGVTTSEAVALKARKALDAFLEHVSQRAQERFEQVLKESDPVKRLQLFETFPKPFRDYTPIDTRIREERPRILEQIDARYAQNERKLAAAIDGGDFAQVRTLIDDMLRGADGARRVRLEKLRGDTAKLEEEFKNEILRKLTRAYGPVHDAFVKSLIARDNAQAYTRVTAFLKGITDEAEKKIARVPQTNYDALIALVPNNVLPDSRLGQVRLLMLSAFNDARDSLPYRILSDLQDALDVEFLIRSAGQWVKDPASAKRELPLEGLGHGRVTLGGQGIMFYPKAGAPKPVQIRQLHPHDLLLLAGALEDKTPEQVYESNELLCRAAGVAYLHSTLPERWAQASRWLQRAHDLNVRGIAFRLEGIREQGYREVRDRVTQAQAEAAQKKIEPAKRRLAEIARAWAHEPALKEEIDRALAGILLQELRQLEGSPDHARIKQVARALRESHAGQYDEETVLRIYAAAARASGFWHTVPTALKDETWTWPGKAEGSLPPAADETTAGRGIRLKGGQSVGLHASKVKGGTGFSASIAVFDATRPFAAGIRFDTSDTDPRYRRLVIHNTEVALYRGDGTREERIARAPLPKKVASGQWVDLAYAVEGNDLICYVEKREVFIVAAAPGPDRGIALISTGDASFRSLTLRR